MSTLFLAGSGFNLLEGASTITVSDEDSLFPKANLYDGRPSQPFKFDTAGADRQVTVDLGSATNVDFCSIHGHNIDSGVTAIQFRSSTDNFSGSDTLEATMTKATPTFFTWLSAPVNRRYWRVKFVGTNGSAIELGELVLGDATALARRQRYPHEFRYRRRQIRTETRSGEIAVFNLCDFEERAVRLDFRHNETAYKEMRDSLFQATEGGALPMVIVPDSAEEDVIYGRISNEWTVQKLFDDIFEDQLTIVESPMIAKVT